MARTKPCRKTAKKTKRGRQKALAKSSRQKQQVAVCTACYCGDGFIKTSSMACGKTDFTQDQCCTPEDVYTDFNCGDGFLKTSTDAYGNTECSQTQCCTPEAVCTAFDCGDGFLKTSSIACGKIKCAQNQCCTQEAVRTKYRCGAHLCYQAGGNLRCTSVWSWFSQAPRLFDRLQ